MSPQAGDPWDPRSLGRAMAERVVQASDLRASTRRAIEREASQPGGRVILVAFGKGACAMAEGALQALPRLDGGVVVTPEKGPHCRLPGLETLTSTHPVPSKRSVRAAEAVLEWARGAREGDLFLALVSGGGSALVEKPLPGLTLGDIVETTRVLLASGLSILEVNTVRKHLSQVKGGRLAEAARPARVLGVYASDVPGDRLDLIASGPTVPDPTTYQDALEIIRVNRLEHRLPERVLETLEKGVRGEIPETPKPGSPVFERVENRLSATNLDVLRSLERWLAARGYRTLTLTSRLEGESREVGKALASIALEALHRGVPEGAPLAILAGGETSVTVRNPQGRGGRNMELALSTALRIDYWDPGLEPGRIVVVSLDTDGIDGNTDAAGAVTYNGILREARAHGIDLARALQENNTYEPLDRLGLLLRTGPTGSNLNSVTVIVIR